MTKTAKGAADGRRSIVSIDAELITLVDQLLVANDLYEDASSVADDLQGQLFRRAPATPAAVTASLRLDAAHARANELFQEARALARQVMVTPATTLEGARAKARAIVQWCWPGGFDDVTDEPDDLSLMASIVRDLAGLRAV